MKPICLVDMDSTIADHNTALDRDMAKLAAPGEPTYDWYDDNAPEYIKARKKMVRSQSGWWYSLKPLYVGFQVVYIAKNIGYHLHVLTKGPWSSSNAWSEKFDWCKNHLGDDIEVTVTMDKGLVYGAVLIDDYPDYIKSWLEFRPRGVVIMPATSQNTKFTHPQVTRCDGINFKQVTQVLEEQYLRVTKPVSPGSSVF